MNIKDQIRNCIYISIGAVPGALLRWQTDQIFLINFIGCFFIGFFNFLSFDSRYKLILCIGFCGSLTTFSGWILDLFILISEGFYIQALLNLMLMLVIGLLAVCLGNLFGGKIYKLLK